MYHANGNFKSGFCVADFHTHTGKICEPYRGKCVTWSRVRLDTHMEGWSYHHLQDGHFGSSLLLGFNSQWQDPGRSWAFGMVKLKQRTEVTWAAEVEFSSSSGAESCPLELEAAHRDQLTVHAPQFVRDLMDLATRYFRCVVQTTSIQFVIHVASRRQPPAPHRSLLLPLFSSIAVAPRQEPLCGRHGLNDFVLTPSRPLVTANDVGHWDQKHPKVLIVGKKNAKNLIAMYSGPPQFKK